jgi:hypothetical protein
MTFNALEDLYAEEAEVATETATDEFTSITRNMTIETPLFDITFKKFRFKDNEFDPSRSIVSLDMFGFADKLVVQIASESIKLRELICGDEAMADENAPMMHELFADGKVKPEYVGILTESQITKAELAHAQILGMIQTITALTAARDEFFPHSTRPLQYAWNSVKREGITDIKAAIAYRVSSSPKMAKIKLRVANRRAGGKEISALGYGSAAAILGI